MLRVTDDITTTLRDFTGYLLRKRPTIPGRVPSIRFYMGRPAIQPIHEEKGQTNYVNHALTAFFSIAGCVSKAYPWAWD